MHICNDEDYISTFVQFRLEDDCPSSVKLKYERAKLKFELLKRGIQEVISPARESIQILQNMLKMMKLEMYCMPLITYWKQQMQLKS